MWSDDQLTDDWSFYQKASLRWHGSCSGLFLLLSKCTPRFVGRVAFILWRWSGRGRGSLTGVCVLSPGHLQRGEKAWPHGGDRIGWCEPEKRPLLWRTRAASKLAVNSLLLFSVSGLHLLSSRPSYQAWEKNGPVGQEKVWWGTHTRGLLLCNSSKRWHPPWNTRGPCRRIQASLGVTFQPAALLGRPLARALSSVLVRRRLQ